MSRAPPLFDLLRLRVFNESQRIEGESQQRGIGKPAGSGKVAHDLDSKLGSTCRVWKRRTRPKARLVLGFSLSLPVTTTTSSVEIRERHWIRNTIKRSSSSSLRGTTWVKYGSGMKEGIRNKFACVACQLSRLGQQRLTNHFRPLRSVTYNRQSARYNWLH